ncbi:MAG: hypothetical protein ACLRWQ_14115 [Flavonifractor plautii]
MIAAIAAEVFGDGQITSALFSTPAGTKMRFSSAEVLEQVQEYLASK